MLREREREREEIEDGKDKESAGNRKWEGKKYHLPDKAKDLWKRLKVRKSKGRTLFVVYVIVIVSNAYLSVSISFVNSLKTVCPKWNPLCIQSEAKQSLGGFW